MPSVITAHTYLGVFKVSVCIYHYTPQATLYEGLFVQYFLSIYSRGACWTSCLSNYVNSLQHRSARLYVYIYIYIYIEGTHEAFDHLVSFSSSRETISWLRIELPTTRFGLGISPILSSSLGSSRTKLARFHEIPNYFDNVSMPTLLVTA
jgi:hypothetical protein